MQSVSKPAIYPGAGFCYVLMRESGCRNHYQSVLVAETKAKTVTSPLIIPSLLAKCASILLIVADPLFDSFFKSGCRSFLSSDYDSLIPLLKSRNCQVLQKLSKWLLAKCAGANGSVFIRNTQMSHLHSDSWGIKIGQVECRGTIPMGGRSCQAKNRFK